jgi:hypothetical protein
MQKASSAAQTLMVEEVADLVKDKCLDMLFCRIDPYS